MDPNANLEELRRLVVSLNEDWDNDVVADSDDAFRMTELVEALDGWITRGGALPEAWTKKKGGAG